MTSALTRKAHRRNETQSQLQFEEAMAMKYSRRSGARRKFGLALLMSAALVVAGCGGSGGSDSASSDDDSSSAINIDVPEAIRAAAEAAEAK